MSALSNRERARRAALATMVRERREREAASVGLVVDSTPPGQGVWIDDRFGRAWPRLVVDMLMARERIDGELTMLAAAAEHGLQASWTRERVAVVATVFRDRVRREVRCYLASLLCERRRQQQGASYDEHRVRWEWARAKAEALVGDLTTRQLAALAVEVGRDVERFGAMVDTAAADKFVDEVKNNYGDK